MKPVTHYPPSRDTGLTKCCGKRMQEIYGNTRKGDRFASDPARVTCGKGEQ